MYWTDRGQINDLNVLGSILDGSIKIISQFPPIQSNGVYSYKEVEDNV